VRASFGRQATGTTAATIMSGYGAVGSVSAADIIGFPTVGTNADRVGTTSEDIGSAEFPNDW